MKRELDFSFLEGRGQVLYAQVPLKLQDQVWATSYTIAVYAAIRRYTKWGTVEGAYPSIARIVEKSHVSRAQVVRELKKLRQHGWIEWISGEGWVETTSGKKRKANVYRVHLDPDAPEYMGAEAALPETASRMTALPETSVARMAALPETSMAALPEHLSIHSTNDKQTTITRDAEILEIFTYWQKTLGYRSKLDEARRSKIAARLADGFTVAQLKDVVDRTKKDPWRQGDNPRRKRYDGIDLIFRNAAKVEEYLSIARGTLPGAMPQDGPETGTEF